MQVVLGSVIVDKFWGRNNEIWNFSKISAVCIIDLILGCRRGHVADNSTFLLSLKFLLSGHYIRFVSWRCSSKARL